MIAAFQKWTKVDAAKLLVKLAKWSIRAQFAGRLGGGVAEEAFGEAALSITNGSAASQTAIRDLLAKLIPNDAEFIVAFTNYGDVSVSRAKYLLAMLEKADDVIHGRAERPLEWQTRAVTIEHVLSLSTKTNSETNAAVVNQIGNLALLEKRLNTQAGSKPFEDKRSIYRDSVYTLTKRVALKRTWKPISARRRTAELAILACHAWPAR